MRSTVEARSVKLTILRLGDAYAAKDGLHRPGGNHLAALAIPT